MSEQAFSRGDVVMIASDLGSSMSHFRGGAEAIVLYSYAERFWGDDHNSYSVMFTDDGSECSWYYGQQFELVRHGGEDEIRRVIAEREARMVHERDLGWIAANWPRIRGRTPGATCEELMRRVGIDNPWGSQGEGMAWYANWRQTFAAVDPILSDTAANVENALASISLTPIDVRIGG